MTCFSGPKAGCNSLAGISWEVRGRVLCLDLLVALLLMQQGYSWLSVLQVHIASSYLIFHSSVWETRTEDLLRQPWKGPSRDFVSWRSLLRIPTCHCAPVLLCACWDGSFLGWWLLWWPWKCLGQGIVWALPTFLRSFVSVQRSFYHLTISCYTMSIHIRVFLFSHWNG